MEDFIMREINKIGKLIEALLTKIGILRRSGSYSYLYDYTKVELAEKLNVDIDTLLGNDDFADILIREHGFSDDNLEKFAELLFDMVEAAPDETSRTKLVGGILVIYDRLDSTGSYISLNRHHITRELEKYIGNPGN